MPNIFCPRCGDVDIATEEFEDFQSCPFCGTPLDGDDTPQGCPTPWLTCPNCGYAGFLDAVADEPICPFCEGDLVYGEAEAEPVGRPRPRGQPPEGEPPDGVHVAGQLWILGGIAGLALGLLFFYAVSGVLMAVTGSAHFVDLWGIALVVFHGGLIWVGYGVSAGRPRPVALAGWLGLVGALVCLGAAVGYQVGFNAARAALPPRPGGFGQAPTPAPGVELGMVLAFLLTLVYGMILVMAVVLLWQSGRYDAWQRGTSDPDERTSPFPVAAWLAGWMWLLVGPAAAILLKVQEDWVAAHAPRLGPAGRVETVGLVFQAVAWLLTVSYLGLVVLLGRVPATGGISMAVGFLAFLGVVSAFHQWVPPLSGSTPDPAAAARRPADEAVRLGSAVLSLVCLAAAGAGVVGDEAYRRWARRGHG